METTRNAMALSFGLAKRLFYVSMAIVCHAAGNAYAALSTKL
jgi:hypothetical protein